MGQSTETEVFQPEYVLSKTRLLSYLPSTWVPNAELIRLDKPTGSLYLFFPCIFGAFLAAILAEPITPLSKLLAVNLCFFVGSIVVRGVGCTWNDILDREVDRKVSRTRLRPMARSAVSVHDAIYYTIIQLLIISGLLLKWSTTLFLFSIPLFVLTGLYPLAKRVTNYPQVVLGCAFSWGIIMASAALNIDILVVPTRLIPSGCLYISAVFWTTSYDTVYALQDVKDDPKAGVKSIAVRHKDHTKTLLAIIALIQVLLLLITGLAAGLGPVYFARTCCGTALASGAMVQKLDVESPANCLWWFKYECWITGGAVSTGLIGEYLMRMILV